MVFQARTRATPLLLSGLALALNGCGPDPDKLSPGLRDAIDFDTGHVNLEEQLVADSDLILYSYSPVSAGIPNSTNARLFFAPEESGGVAHYDGGREFRRPTTEVIAKLRSWVPEFAAPDFAAAGFSLLEYNTPGQYAVLGGPGNAVPTDGVVSTTGLLALTESLLVESIEANRTFELPRRIDINSSCTPDKMSCSREQLDCDPAFPNDPEFRKGSLWGLESIRAPAVWRSGIHDAADDVLLAIIDSGVNYDHPDLRANIDPRGAAFSGPECDSNSRDLQDNCDPRDVTGHGTFVASVIGADEGEFGSVGVAWSVRMLPIRIGDAAHGYDVVDMEKAIRYAGELGAKIVNISLRIEEHNSNIVRDAIADYSDMLIIAAAGNYTGRVSYPAAFDLDNIISVSGIRAHSCTEQADPGAYAFHKEQVDLAAPAEGICGLCPGPTHEYCFGMGTSFATPFVSAAAALIWSQPRYRDYSAIEIKQLILENSRPSDYMDGLSRTDGVLDIGFLAGDPALCACPSAGIE